MIAWSYYIYGIALEENSTQCQCCAYGSLYCAAGAAAGSGAFSQGLAAFSPQPLCVACAMQMGVWGWVWGVVGRSAQWRVVGEARGPTHVLGAALCKGHVLERRSNVLPTALPCGLAAVRACNFHAHCGWGVFFCSPTPPPNLLYSQHSQPHHVFYNDIYERVMITKNDACLQVHF